MGGLGGLGLGLGARGGRAVRGRAVVTTTGDCGTNILSFFLLNLKHVLLWDVLLIPVRDFQLGIFSCILFSIFGSSGAGTTRQAGTGQKG